MSNNMEIIIREETIRQLRLNTDSRLLRYLKNATKTFCAYQYRDAVSTLFTLLYEDNKQPLNAVLMKLNFTLYAEVSFNLDKDCLFIEMDSVIPIAEELQFQYMSAHPTFLKLHEYPQCEEEFEALKSVMVNHPLLLHRAVNSVWHAHEDSENVQNSIHLLLSEKKTSQAKGLEKLGHKPHYQRLLIPYAKEIAQFLKAMNNAFNKEQQLAIEAQKNDQARNTSHKNQLIAAAREELNSAFAPLALIWDKVPAEAEPAIPEEPVTVVAPVLDAEQSTDAVVEADKNDVCEQPEDNQVEYSMVYGYPVSPELFQFLNNKSALIFSIPHADEFWKQMAKLRDIGIDLNLLVDNLQYLLAVLSAHDNLDKASDELAKAEKEYRTAVENFSPDDMNTLHALTAAGKVFQDAKNNYAATYDIFVTACDTFHKATAKA